MIANRSLIIIIMLTALPIIGQTYSSSNHHIEYSIGLKQIKEENLIPKVHPGLNHFVSYEYETRDQTYQCIEFYLGYGTMKTEIENETVSYNARVLLGYCYDMKIIDNDNFQYFLGPGLSYSSSLAEYENFDEAHHYWGNFLSLGINNAALLNIDQDKYFIFKCNISILGVYTRPDYNRLYANEYWKFSNVIEILNSHYKFGLFNNAFQFRIAAGYRTKLWGENYLSLGLSIFFSRIKANDEKPLKELIPGLTVGVVI